MAVKKTGAKKPILRKQAGKAKSSKKSVVKTAPKAVATTKPKARKQEGSRRKRDTKGKFLPGVSGNEATQFKPGKSGNPSGRKGSVVDELRRKLPAVRVESDGRSNASLVVDALLEEAIEKRNVQAIREIFDRVEGKPKQTVDLTVMKSEIEKYENMIFQYMEASKSDGFEISREEAITYLSKHDTKILEHFPLTSESTH